MAEKRAVYWSRSWAKLWRKGEGFWNVQRLLEIRLDGEPICYRVEHIGGIACNTDRAYSFYQRLENVHGERRTRCFSSRSSSIRHERKVGPAKRLREFWNIQFGYKAI